MTGIFQGHGYRMEYDDLRCPLVGCDGVLSLTEVHNRLASYENHIRATTPRTALSPKTKREAFAYKFSCPVCGSVGVVAGPMRDATTYPTENAQTAVETAHRKYDSVQIKIKNDHFLTD